MTDDPKWDDQSKYDNPVAEESMAGTGNSETPDGVFNPQALVVPPLTVDLHRGESLELLYRLQNCAESDNLNRWHDFRLAERDGEQVVASINLCHLGMRGEMVASGGFDNTSRFWINRLWVATEHRRRGFGTYLLELAVAVARHQHHERLFGLLEPFDDTPLSVLEEFYRRFGFESDGSWPNQDENVWTLRIENRLDSKVTR